jgi:hypothetical protein
MNEDREITPVIAQVGFLHKLHGDRPVWLVTGRCRPSKQDVENRVERRFACIKSLLLLFLLGFA